MYIYLYCHDIKITKFILPYYYNCKTINVFYNIFLTFKWTANKNNHI